MSTDTTDPVGSAARLTLRRLTRRRPRSQSRNALGIAGLVILVLVGLFALLGPWLIGQDPNHQDLDHRVLPIWSYADGQLHVLGTDGLGRDVLARLAAGSRASLSVVLAALVLGGGLGTLVGVVAGYRGGTVDTVAMRLVDAQFALPTLVFAMIIAAIFGAGYWSTVIAVGFASWPTYTRLIRAEVLRVKSQEYVEAARALGVSTLRLVRVHILPNVLGVVAVVGTLELGVMVLIESSLSFVGLGMQPPDASWGSMVASGQDYIFTAWWLSVIPAVAVMMTVLGMNLLGDWFRDLLDPRSS